MPIPPVPPRPTAPIMGLLRDEVYTRLCAAIVDSTFLPGEQLRDGDLAAWLGVSRTPVREALLRLAQSGLVIATPGQSTVVATIDPYAVRDALEVVASMHALAVRTAAPHIRPGDLAVMRRANQRFAEAVASGDADAAMSADDDLHGVPVVVAANAALAGVLGQYLPVLRRVERQRFASLSGRRSVALHERLIAALARGDAEAAVLASDQTWSTLALLLDLDLDPPVEPGARYPGDGGHPSGGKPGGGGQPRGIWELRSPTSTREHT